MRTSDKPARASNVVYLLAVAFGVLASAELTALADGIGSNTVSGDQYLDSFEDYAVGAGLVTDGTGWYSDATDAVKVVAFDYSSLYTGQYPLTTNHNQVLKLDSPVTNAFVPLDTDPVTKNMTLYVDVVIQPKQWEEPTTPLCRTTC